MNNGAFDFGNAIAAWSAGLAIDASLGYPAASLVGAGLTGLGLILALVSRAIDRRPGGSQPDLAAEPASARR